ncbi:MAG: hypothetical protein HY584_04965 [Candidatus Omnitrophica bacterium]|nr:hypothetical protein [Candidatus Omnitrophota bacterium]
MKKLFSALLQFHQIKFLPPLWGKVRMGGKNIELSPPPFRHTNWRIRLWRNSSPIKGGGNNWSKALFIFLSLYSFFISQNTVLYGSEVFQDTDTQVVVREHPKTGKPYVSIISHSALSQVDPFERLKGKMSRPDYRMLDPKVKSGEIPYEGPYSSSTKIYVFAATLATLGTVGGAVGLATVPAAATGAAASGGGAYLAGGAAVAGGAAGAAALATRSDSRQDDFIQTSKSESIEKLNNGK